MHPIDWSILIGTILLITAYGMWKTRGKQDMQTYLLGNRELKWWTIGLSIMATQASAITFLSTTGQGYEDGMRFVQFYFGLPLAMVILSAFFLPIFYRLKVYTAYEYLEGRFDLRMRTLTAVLFLMSRGMAAGLTICAPAIVLSTIFHWDLVYTNLFLGLFVIIYTVFGGGDAVSVTQQQQMIIILSGMILAFVVMIFKLPQEVSLGDAMRVAGKLNKINLVDFKFDLSNRYNFWSGMLGGTFLFLAYFGTDQSQVQRYLSGKTLQESRLGLLFNGMIKVPMQFLVLLVGVMMFVFYQFTQSPIHFNVENLEKVQQTAYASRLETLQQQYNTVFTKKKEALGTFVKDLRGNDVASIEQSKLSVEQFQKEDKAIRNEVRALIKEADPSAETKDTDYVFISFIMAHLPVGIIGILLAVIFAAAMSSTASELNALATASVIDIYRRQIVTDRPDEHYMKASQWFTAGWGIIVLFFAISASLFENLIEAVNIIGSLFYGTILGIFVVGFFVKKVKSQAVFYGALLSEAIVVTIFILDKLAIFKFAYLWLNLLGCTLVVLFSLAIQQVVAKKED